MTILQILNSLFYLIIFRYLINTLGKEAYGVYQYGLAIVMFFVAFVTFGLDMPGVKKIAPNQGDLDVISDCVSCIFTIRIYLEIISAIIFTLLLATIPVMIENRIVFGIIFFQTLTAVLFPTWFFQGIQKMKVITYIQVLFKLLSLPAIFLTIKTPDDLWIFALIATSTAVLGGITATLMIRFHFKVKIKWIPFHKLRGWIKDAFPFFLSSSTGILKQEGIKIIIGSFIGMGEVTVYDLANKIIMVPRTLLISINGALFPKLVVNAQKHIVRKIIKIETLIGLLVILAIAVFGKYIVLLMGGTEVIDAYPVSAILSVVVLTWLVVGAYIDFVFIPNNRYYFVTKNQLFAFFSFFLFCFAGLLFVQNVYVLAISMSLSGLLEIAYCVYLSKKYDLL